MPTFVKTMFWMLTFRLKICGENSIKLPAGIRRLWYEALTADGMYTGIMYYLFFLERINKLDFWEI